MANRDMGYNRGPSCWLHCCAIVFPGDVVQMVFCLDGSNGLGLVAKPRKVKKGDGVWAVAA